MKKIYITYAVTVFISGVMIMVALFTSLAEPAQADAENGCVVIGSVGNVTVGRCIDPETEDVIYVNTVGMLEIRKD